MRSREKTNLKSKDWSYVNGERLFSVTSHQRWKNWLVFSICSVLYGLDRSCLFCGEDSKPKRSALYHFTRILATSELVETGFYSNRDRRQRRRSDEETGVHCVCSNERRQWDDVALSIGSVDLNHRALRKDWGEYVDERTMMGLFFYLFVRNRTGTLHLICSSQTNSSFWLESERKVLEILLTLSLFLTPSQVIISNTRLIEDIECT